MVSGKQQNTNMEFVIWLWFISTMQKHAHIWQKQEGMYTNKNNCVTVLALEGILKIFLILLPLQNKT